MFLTHFPDDPEHTEVGKNHHRPPAWLPNPTQNPAHQGAVGWGSGFCKFLKAPGEASVQPAWRT